ncbi:aminoacyl-tRNA hydrolase [Patescibacteria group bacterium]|nr:aminoacyl-tRNA hydrolase [Patescibacteria group bacterium]
MRLLVGLGNPGLQYEKTRHNIGFACVDRVAERLGVTDWKEFRGGLLATAAPGQLIFKPQQYMNSSGNFVRQVVDFYHIAVSDICIMADDVYIAPGSIRVRHGGGDGGHNGWKSVLEQLHSDSFWRIRIGVGIYEQHPHKRLHQPPLDEYVLQPLPAHEKKRVDEAIDKVAPNLINWLEHGMLTEETLHTDH